MSTTGNGVFLVRTELFPTAELSFGDGSTTTVEVAPSSVGALRRTTPVTGSEVVDELAARCADQAWLTDRTTDSASWRPVIATAPGDGNHVLVLENSTGVLLNCPTWGWQPQASSSGARRSERDFEVLASFVEAGTAIRYLTGAVGDRVTAVELTDAQGRPAAEVVLENGWFAAKFTDQDLYAVVSDYRVQVLAGKEVLYAGSAKTN